MNDLTVIIRTFSILLLHFNVPTLIITYIHLHHSFNQGLLTYHPARSPSIFCVWLHLSTIPTSEAMRGGVEYQITPSCQFWIVERRSGLAMFKVGQWFPMDCICVSVTISWTFSQKFTQLCLFAEVNWVRKITVNVIVTLSPRWCLQIALLSGLQPIIRRFYIQNTNHSK